MRTSRRRVLVSNDDGIHAPGLHALAAALAAAGHDVMVVAPDQDMTASGTSAGGRDADRTVTYEPVELSGLPGIPAYIVAGPPALGVMTACRSGFGAPPDVVAVGINAGLNTGGRVVYSGTVGAAVVGASYGARAAAISMQGSDATSLRRAAAAATAAVDWLAGLDPEQQAPTVNINVPCADVTIRGAALARLAAVSEGRAFFVEHEPGVLLRRTEASGLVVPVDSDVALVRAGYITITPIQFGEAREWLTPTTSMTPLVGLVGLISDRIADRSSQGSDAPLSEQRP